MAAGVDIHAVITGAPTVKNGSIVLQGLPTGKYLTQVDTPVPSAPSIGTLQSGDIYTTGVGGTSRRWNYPTYYTA